VEKYLQSNKRVGMGEGTIKEVRVSGKMPYPEAGEPKFLKLV
jgi:hypothetical protein